MPSRAWYVVAALIFFAGIAGATWMVISRISGMGTALVQIVVPGSAELDLKEHGTYTIFHERTSQVDGRVFTPADISGLRVAVRSADGAEIAVRQTVGRTTYNFSGRSGTAVLSFDVDAPGRYRLTAAYPDGRQQPQAVLAVGTGFVGELLSTIFLALGIGLGGILVAVALAVAVAVKRRRAIRGAA